MLHDKLDRMIASRACPPVIAVRHEELDDGHLNITYRHDVSLPFLAEAILAQRP